MNLLSRSVISTGGVAAAALLLALASPRAVQALGEQLVSIANTATHPAVVEEVPHFASHLVTLQGYATSNYLSEPFLQQTPNGFAGTPFVVPAGQTFVITGIDIMPVDTALPTDTSVIQVQDSGAGLYGVWTVAGSVTTEFQYPSGILVESGKALTMNSTLTGTLVKLHGYLTPA
jgi:hypothetical protein